MPCITESDSIRYSTRVKTLSVTEVARNFSAVLDALEREQEEIVLVRNRRHVARLVPEAPRQDALSVFGNLFRTLDDGTVAALSAAIASQRKGRWGRVSELRTPCAGRSIPACGWPNAPSSGPADRCHHAAILKRHSSLVVDDGRGGSCRRVAPAVLGAKDMITGEAPARRLGRPHPAPPARAARPEDQGDLGKPGAHAGCHFSAGPVPATPACGS